MGAQELRENIIKLLDDINNVKILTLVLGYINNIKNKGCFISVVLQYRTFLFFLCIIN